MVGSYRIRWYCYFQKAPPHHLDTALVSGVESSQVVREPHLLLLFLFRINIVAFAMDTAFVSKGGRFAVF